MMESAYDEDLNENSFFQTLQVDYRDLFQKAISEGWVICVPRTGSVPKYVLTVEDFFSHILIPNDELPGSHFKSVNDKDIRILNRVITVEQGDIIPPYSTHILFEETFYTEDIVKFKVLCIESPLEPRSEVRYNEHEIGRNVSLHTLRDCIDFLWTESAGKKVLEEMDVAIKNFSESQNLEFETLQLQKDCVSALYVNCLQIVLQDQRLRENYNKNKHFQELIKLSVETYMHHVIYKNLIKCISACAAYEDAQLNKIIRNLSDIQLRDFSIRADLYDAVIPARQELARLDRYSTPLGKFSCLRRMVNTISKPNSTLRNSLKDKHEHAAIATDDLLSVMVFLVLKTVLSNWIAQLTYMKQFHFSSRSSCGNEYNFMITSLEAAIEHIKSGVLQGPLTPEAQLTYEDFDMKSETGEASREDLSDVPSVDYFFTQIKKGNALEVRKILDRALMSSKSGNSSDTSKHCDRLNENISSLCHPLCSCEKCEQLLSNKLCDITPTVNSCDDRGFTALHVASLFGHPIIVDVLILHEANINATDFNGSTPLHFACAKGHQNAVLLLIHSGADMGISDSDGNTPLHLASNNGHEDCVKALLYYAEHINLKLNTNAININGDTPLHHASRWGYAGIVEILLEHGADPNIENKRHSTPLSLAHNLHVLKLMTDSINEIRCIESFVVIPSINKDNESVKKNFRPVSSQLDFSDQEENVSSNSPTRKLQSFRPKSLEEMKLVEKLLKAVSIGDIQLASYYLGLETPFERIDFQKPSDNIGLSLCHPLCSCESCTSDQNCDDLHERLKTTMPVSVKRNTLNINVCNADGLTPLHVASMKGRVEIVRLLLDNGALLNVRSRVKGATPLHLACQNEQLRVVRLLVQSGNCDLDVTDFFGNTPLHYCCRTGNPQLVGFLLKCGPNLTIKNCDGNTPLDEAEEKLYFTIVKLLKGGKSMVLPLEI